MAANNVKLEIPFQQLLVIIEQLGPDEKIMIKKKLEREKVTTWQEMFGYSLNEIAKSNDEFTETEVLSDVNAAIAEVRSGVRN
ncbi:hypothetical protein [Candidatus Magnetominusculus dajiuhuensis]|uniref:hypothetical protein n=1 Tax=Candidatus Magnetominusculus dajiuhuensis TaxID=3137712 RepID=UPI003B437646